MIPAPLPPPVTFPPAGWLPHPQAEGQYYCGDEVLWEEQLRERCNLPAPIPSAPAANPALLRMLEETTGIPQELPANGVFDLPVGADLVAEEPAAEPLPIPAQWDTTVHDATQRETMVWRRETAITDVEVTVSERMLFVKQGFNNKEITFTVTLGPEQEEVRMEIRSLSNKALAALYESLGIDRKAGMFGDIDNFDAGYFATRMQILSMMLQIVSVGGDFQPWIHEDQFETLSQQDLAIKLSQEATEWGNSLSAPRHTLFVTAVRIFEEKVRICKEALANGDFSDPAS